MIPEAVCNYELRIAESWSSERGDEFSPCREGKWSLWHSQIAQPLLGELAQAMYS